MALRTFTDNLINLATESCLIQDLPGLFTPRLVNSLDNSKLAKLAAESEDVRNHRLQLQGDIQLLKQGLEQCRRHRPRATTRGQSHIRTLPNSKVLLTYFEELAVASSAPAVPQAPQNGATRETSKTDSKASSRHDPHQSAPTQHT